MDDKRKKYIDSLWFDSFIYKIHKLLAEGKEKEAVELKREFDTDPFAYSYELQKIREILSSEFSDAEEYFDYIQLIEKENAEMAYHLYKNDIFGSFMVKKLI